VLSEIIRKTLYFTDHVHAICVPHVQSYRFPYLMRKATKVVGYMTPEGKRFHSWAANLHTGSTVIGASVGFLLETVAEGDYPQC
jgi:hypothetical protein